MLNRNRLEDIWEKLLRTVEDHTRQKHYDKLVTEQYPVPTYNEARKMIVHELREIAREEKLTNDESEYVFSKLNGTIDTLIYYVIDHYKGFKS